MRRALQVLFAAGAIAFASCRMGSEQSGTPTEIPEAGAVPPGPPSDAATAIDETGASASDASDSGGAFTDATPQTPASCAAAKAQNPRLVDGDVTIDPDGPGPLKPFVVYCIVLDSTPREYLSLAHSIATQEPQSNFSRFAGGNACPCPDLVRSFTKVRLDVQNPSDLRILIDDYTYASFNRAVTCEVGQGNCHGPNMRFGQGGSCISAYDTTGTANVDLRGTGFAVRTTQVFGADGFLPGGSATFSTTRETVTLTGGGYCGWWRVLNAPDGGAGADTMSVVQVP